MHIIIRPTRRTFVAAACLLAAAFSAAASAATILLEVDVSDPSAVTFAATGAAPTITDDDSHERDGVTLKGLFDDDFDSFFDAPSSFMTGNLKARGARSYREFTNDFADVGLRDINLFRFSFNARVQSFDTGSPAFTGVGVVDLTGANFTVGTVGDILAGDTSDVSPVIGQFEIVGGTPIPSPAAAAGGLAMLAVIALRRR